MPLDASVAQSGISRGPLGARTRPVRVPYGARWKNTMKMEISKKEKCIIQFNIFEYMSLFIFIVFFQWAP